jgi:hypothetical protein
MQLVVCQGSFDLRGIPQIKIDRLLAVRGGWEKERNYREQSAQRGEDQSLLND